MDIFNVCSMTQTIIFMNTKSFSETLHGMMRKNGYKSTLIFGDMSKEERDEYVQKFRNGEVNVIITTNMLARGLDVPEVEIVINFDVPAEKDFSGEKRGAPETYLHRIGRAGRFGAKGIAITIYDRDEDKKYLDQISDHFNMKEMIKELQGPDHLKQLLEQIREI